MFIDRPFYGLACPLRAVTEDLRYTNSNSRRFERVSVPACASCPILANNNNAIDPVNKTDHPPVRNRQHRRLGYRSQTAPKTEKHREKTPSAVIDITQFMGNKARRDRTTVVGARLSCGMSIR